MISADVKITSPAYDDELKACEDKFGEILRSINKQDKYMVDVAMLRKAFNKAKELHGDTRRNSGILYLRHPLAVMERLSRLCCGTSILAAALLHDTIEDCGYTKEKLREDFTPEIAEIVSAVTAIKENEANMDGMNANDRHDLLDRLTDAKLIKSKYQREAFLVRFADREHNLSTLDACKLEKQHMKIEQTEMFLIPAAHQIGARYFEISLCDYCLKFSGDDFESETLKNFRNDCASISGTVFSEFDNLLQDGIKAQDFFTFPAYNPFARLRGSRRDGKDELSVEKRRMLRPYEIKCQLNGRRDYTRGDICLSEVILTCAESSKAVILSQFIAFYQEHLRQQQVYFEYDSEDEISVVVRLVDRYDNNYRIVLVPANKLDTYFMGCSDRKTLELAGGDSIADALRPKMTVYACSNYKKPRKCIVPIGATALDFAFIVSRSLALTVKAARIQKWIGDSTKFLESDYRYPLKTVLKDGDAVCFDADYHPATNYAVNRVTIDWFGYINTENARDCLISYFKSILPQS